MFLKFLRLHDYMIINFINKLKILTYYELKQILSTLFFYVIIEFNFNYLAIKFNIQPNIQIFNYVHQLENILLI